MADVRMDDLCLTKIISSFEIFNYAYGMSIDPFLQRNLEFLQRAYSAELIARMSTERKLCANYLKFLLNRFVKDLDFSKFDSCPWESVLDGATEIAENLLKVTFDEEMFFQHHERLKGFIELLQNVKHLFLPFECDDEIVKIISRSCPNLIELDLYVSTVSDDALRSLCSARFGSCIRILHLRSLSRNEKIIASILTSMPCLEILNNFYLVQALQFLHRYDLFTNKLNAVKKYTLTHLNLSCVQPSDCAEALTICTVLCPDIRNLSCCVYMQNHIDLLCNFNKLQDLDLNYSEEDLLDLNNFLKIKGLNLISLQINGRFLVYISVLIENCLKLEKLCLLRLKLQWTKNVNVCNLKRMERLKIFSISIPYLSTEDLSLLLNSSPNVVCLSLSTTLHLKSAILKNCDLKKLKYFNIVYAVLDVNFVTLILKSCTSLKILNLHSCYNLSEYDCRIITAAASAAKNSPAVTWNRFARISDDGQFMMW
ncbi:hypothetical protein X975_23498, partial [Stegodyphus mimosarum]